VKFVPVEWFLANLQPLSFEIWPNISIFGIWYYINDELQIKFSFCSHWIILAKLLSLDFRILHSIQVVVPT
jgi:hypothetical protein